MSALPETMKALVLPAHHPDLETALASLRLETRPVPRPGPGQVLVEVYAAPCNPSDLLYLQDRYGITKPLPAVPGWEGSGTVVASGGGLHAWALKGSRVACAGQGEGDGTWAEYFVAAATSCVPLVAGMDLDQAAMLIVNPLTAVALLDEARAHGARAVVHPAAASQLGRLMIRLAPEQGVTLINLVRRPEQVELLRGLGAEHVLSTAEPDFEARLGELCQRLGARLAFDPVAGAETGRLLRCMGHGGSVLVYGALSEEPCRDIDPVALIFRDQHVGGFWLTEWAGRQSMLGIYRKTQRLQRLMVAGELQSQVRARVGFEEFPGALREYVGAMTAGKVLLKP